MGHVHINKIYMDNLGTICLYPNTSNEDYISTFQFVYRSATGVYWNDNDKFFYLKTKGSQSSIKSIMLILNAIRTELGITLVMDEKTILDGMDISKEELRYINLGTMS